MSAVTLPTVSLPGSVAFRVYRGRRISAAREVERELWRRTVPTHPKPQQVAACVGAYECFERAARAARGEKI